MHTDEWKSEIGEDYDAISKQGESAGSLPTAASVFTFCGQNVQTHGNRQFVIYAYTY